MLCARILSENGQRVVRYGHGDEPRPAAHEVVVNLSAAAVNRVDLYMRDSGAGITHELPLVMGVDGVGVVSDAPSGSRFSAGDPVMIFPGVTCGTCPWCLRDQPVLCRKMAFVGEHRNGTFAERIAVPIGNLFPLPPHLTPAEAAALITGHLTAWRMVFTHGEIRPGHRVLIQGIGGGVALAALQFCVMAGAEVIVTSGSADKLARAMAMGAVAGLDYRTENIPAAVLALTDGMGVDAVFDNVGDVTWASSLRSLTRGGRLVTCGATTGGFPPADLQRIFVRQLRVQGSTAGNPGEFAAMLAAVEHHQLRPVMQAVYPLDQVLAALEAQDAPGRFGKIALTIG